jgi:pimeloyl-ACP methyl ester carboxylesterase
MVNPSTPPSNAQYSQITTRLKARITSQENALPLRNSYCKTELLLQPSPAKRVAIFFHGITAGTYQFMTLGQMLYKAGYTVLIPRLPGHGQAGNWSAQNPPPLPTQSSAYQAFALEWLAIAQSLGAAGAQITVGGLSAGGTIAGWTALERPGQVSRAILVAPYFSSSSKLLDLLMRRSKQYFEWIPVNKSQTAIRGYSGFSVPALSLFLQWGDELLRRVAKQPSPPMFVISSESDIAVGSFDHQDFIEKARKRQPISWYQNFPRALGIPHTMTDPGEGNQWVSVLNVMAKAFIESNLTWSEVEEIGYWMAQGETFNQVVAELGLHHRCSPDMPAMMTMVDKRAIVEARNPSLTWG